MRHLVQPGPAPAERTLSVAVGGVMKGYELTAGADLITALTAPLIAAGMRAGAIAFGPAALRPFRYVLPGPPRDSAHVAWFSDPHEPAGDPARPTMVDYANATFGWRDGKPFVHCHGVWTEPDGTRRGGHMLPEETFLAGPARARAWATRAATITVAPDPETNFPLFQPVAEGPASGDGLRLILARLRPNQDLGMALVALCARHELRAATLRGSLGSLIGARFADGRTVDDPATEVLVRSGRIAPGPDGALTAALDLAVVDGAGRVTEGALAPDENPICITFEALLEAD